MALKVLLADDSVPAQNMGKKILTDAGYEVLAVSNGLEALKKIADSVPDIAILDIFMPGYTGLEVCSRLRGNTVTAGLPVILTVGKLEPYRPEDGEKVHSNAVIVKPFASVELVSAVRSLVGLPFAIRPEAAEVKATPQPAPASTPIPEDDYEEEAPMLAGIGFGSVGFDGVTSAPATSPQQAKFGLAGDPAGGLGWDPDAKRSAFSASAVEEAPAISARAMPMFEAAVDTTAPAGSPGITDFEVGPATAPAGSSAGTATALVEWWQPTPEAVGQSDAADASEIEIPAVADTLPDAASPAAAAVADGSALLEFASTAEASVPDRESRMQAFEALFNSDEAIPVEANPAALPELLAQEELEASHEDESETVAPFALEDGPEQSLPVAYAGATAAKELEETGGHELEFDGDSISKWLTDGEIPHEPQPQIAVPSEQAEKSPIEEPDLNLAVEDSPAQPVVECNLFYAGLPEEPQLAQTTPSESLLESAEPAAVEATSPMVCYPPKEEATEIAPESSFFAALEPEAAEIGCAEVLTPQTAEQSEDEHIVDEQIEAPHCEAQHAEAQMLQESIPAERTNSSAAELASGVMEQMTSERAQAQTENEQSGDEDFREGETDAIKSPGGEAKRIHQAVESVFDRFRPLLIAAIARELTKQD